jgi:hypothetical protein
MLEPLSDSQASTSHPLFTLPAQQAQRSYAAAAAAEEGLSSKSKESVNMRKRKRKPDAWRARLPPGTGRYGTKLAKQYPSQFERMRVILGYYDHIEDHQLPKKITISNLQTLWLLNSIDPYYKLSLLSYRSKLLNQELAGPLQNTNRFLDELAAEQSEFRPILPGLGVDTITSSTIGSKAESSSSSSSAGGVSEGANAEGSS